MSKKSTSVKKQGEPLSLETKEAHTNILNTLIFNVSETARVRSDDFKKHLKTGLGGFGKGLHKKRISSDDQASSSIPELKLESNYYELKSYLSLEEELKNCLALWELTGHKIVLVFVNGNEDAVALWDLLMTSAATLKHSHEVNILYVFIGSSEWPESPEIKRYENVPCILVKCQADTSGLTGENVVIQKTEKVKKTQGSGLIIFPESSDDGVTPNSNSNGPTSVFSALKANIPIHIFTEANKSSISGSNITVHPAYRYYVLTEENHCKFAKTVLDQGTGQTLPVVLSIVLGDAHDVLSEVFHSAMLQANDTEPSQLLLGRILYINRTGAASVSYEDAASLQLGAMASHALYHELQQVCKPNVPMTPRLSNEVQVNNLWGLGGKQGTLCSHQIPQSLSDDTRSKLCKVYRVVDYVGAKKGFPPIAANDQKCNVVSISLQPARNTHYNATYMDERVCDLIRDVQSGVEKRTRSSSVNPHDMFVLFDPQALLFSERPAVKPSRCYQKQEASTCVAIVPLSKLRRRLGKFDPLKGASEAFPVCDYNNVVDSYIFVDGDVLDRNESFKNDILTPISDVLRKHSGDTPIIHVYFHEKLANVNGDSDTDFHFGFQPNPDTTVVHCWQDICQPLIQTILLLALTQTEATAFDCESSDLRASVESLTSQNKILMAKLALSALGRSTSPRTKDARGERPQAAAAAAFLSKMSEASTDPSSSGDLSELLSKIETSIFRVQGVDETSVCKCLSDAKNPERLDKLFLLAVHSGQVVLAEELLRYTSPANMVANALHAVCALKKEFKGKDAYFSLDKLKSFKESALRFESVAQNIIHDLYSKDKAQKNQRSVSGEMLFKAHDKFGGYRPLDIACEAEARSFLSDTACMSAIATRWSGGLEVSRQELQRNKCYFPWMYLAAIFPCCICRVGCGDIEESREGQKGCVCCKKWFYSVPAVRYFMHGVFHFLLLMLYSYVLLSQLKLASIAYVEWAVCFWVASYMLEEIAQVVCSSLCNTGSTSSTYSEPYFKQFWNWVDVLGITLYVIAFGLRCIATVAESEVLLLIARCFFAVDIIVMYVRFLHFMAFHDIVGPLLITVREMLKDLAYFLLILFAVIFGYGVAIHVLLYQIPVYEHPAYNSVLALPYFQMFGELAIDGVLNSSLDVPGLVSSRNSSTPDAMNYVGLCFTGTFLLVANILLMNLLIARFNTSYSVIHSNSTFHHVTHKIIILEEYQSKFNLPPPFVIISLFLCLLCSPCRCSSCCCKRKAGESNIVLNEMQISKVRELAEIDKIV